MLIDECFSTNVASRHLPVLYSTIVICLTYQDDKQMW